MNLLNNYIARLYLVNVAVVMLLLFGFVVSVDVVTNLSDFARAATEQLAGEDEPSAVRKSLGTAIAVVDIWGPRLLQLYNYLIGVVLVAAMGFTCQQLVKNREFVAMLASGISLYRVARPFVIVAAMFSLLQLVNQEVILPKLAPLLVRGAGDAGDRDVDSFPVRLAPDEEGRIFLAERFDAATPDAPPTMTGLVVFERDEQGVMLRIVRAPSAAWENGAWVLTEGVAEIAPDSPAFEGSLRQPVDRIVTALDPDRLKVRHLQDFAINLGFVELSRMLEGGGLDERAREALDRIRWGRFASILANLVTLIAAMPFFLVRLPRPLLFASLKATPVALAGLTASAAATSLPIAGLPIAVGVFIPPLLLMPLAIYLFTAIRT